MLVTHFNGKTSMLNGVIAFNLKLWFMGRSTVIIVVSSNYNLLLGLELFHVVGIISSTIYQTMFMLDEETYMEHVEDDEYAFKVVNSSIFKDENMWEDLAHVNLKPRV